MTDDSKDIDYTASYPNQPFSQFSQHIDSSSLFLSFYLSSAALAIPLQIAAPFDIYFFLFFFVIELQLIYSVVLAPGEGNGTPLQYSCLENPMDEEPGGLQSMGSLRVGHD